MRYFICVLFFSFVATLFVEGKWKEGRKEKLSDKMKKKLDDRQKEAKEKFEKIVRTVTQRDRTIANTTMRIDKKGGSIIIQRKGQLLRMKIKEVIQRHANGSEVVKYPLKNVNFEFKRDSNDNITYGINAGVVEIKAMLPNSANITLKLFMFSKAANITGEDGNTYELVAGGTKMNLVIGWPEDAAHLDVELAVNCGFKGEFGRKAKKLNIIRGKKGNKFQSITRAPSTFAVCTHAQMTFSPSLQSDNAEVQMSNDYPKSEPLSGDGESIMKMRFRGKKIFYDPTVEVGDDIGDEIEDETSSAIYQTPNTFLTMILFVFSLFKMIF